MLDKIYMLLIAKDAWKTILSGLTTTLEITAGALVIGTVLGVLLGLTSTTKIKPLRLLANAYIAIVRGTPVLMLLLMMFYVILANTAFEAKTVAIITFGLNTAAYVAAIYKTAVQAISIGEIEAARTLGFSAFDTFRFVTFPQAMQISRPVYESTIINLLQWTSVVGYITISDLTRVVNNIASRTMEPVFMITTGILLYLLIAYIIKGIFYLTDAKKGRVMGK